MVRLIDLDPKVIAHIDSLADVNAGLDAIRERDYRGDRTPFYLTCRKWDFVVLLYCNPSEVEFRFPWRESDQEVKGGMVRHSWRNKGTYLKEPIISFTFQTGNIMPRVVNNEVIMSPGLTNLYYIMELLDEDRIYKGQPNYVEIAFNSMTFPVLVLSGFFSPDDFTIPQSSEDIHGFSFTLEFTARKFFPDITSKSQLIKAFKGSGAFNVRSLRNAQAENAASGAVDTAAGLVSDRTPFG